MNRLHRVPLDQPQRSRRHGTCFTLGPLSSASRETQSLGCLFAALLLQTLIPHTADSEYMFLLETAASPSSTVQDPAWIPQKGTVATQQCETLRGSHRREQWPLNSVSLCVDFTGGNGGQERPKPQVART